MSSIFKSLLSLNFLFSFFLNVLIPLSGIWGLSSIFFFSILNLFLMSIIFFSTFLFLFFLKPVILHHYKLPLILNYLHIHLHLFHRHPLNLYQYFLPLFTILLLFLLNDNLPIALLLFQLPFLFFSNSFSLNFWFYSRVLNSILLW